MMSGMMIYPSADVDGKIWNAEETKNDGPAADFIEKLFEKESGKAGGPENEYCRPLSAADMTMDEYKEYIHAKIQEMPVNPSNRRDMMSIRISEAGYAAMKNDPEYEKWVLDTIRAERMAWDPLGSRCGGKYITLYFGASKDEYRGESWRPPCMDEERRRRQEAAERENQRKAERKKRLKEEYKKLLEKRALEKSILERKLQQKRLTEAWAARRREYSRFLQAWSMERYQ